MRRQISLLTLVILCCLAGASAQQDVLRSRVREIVLDVSVRDDHQRTVSGLSSDAFAVRVDGVAQRVASLRQEDAPVSLAIVVDNSGSMRALRPQVNRAALDMVRDSNPADEAFVVNFAEEPYLDQDFTGDAELLRAALEKVSARGATALYDALDASSDHLVRAGKYQKKAILVITDGEDTASRLSLQQALHRIAVDGGPAIFAIGLAGRDWSKGAKKALRELTAQTGGAAYFPENIEQIDGMAREIAADLRNQYVLVAHLSIEGAPGAYHAIAVAAKARRRGHLTARTRAGFYEPVADGGSSSMRARKAAPER